MRRFFSMYRAFFAQQIKALMEYKADFAAGMIALGFQQAATFLVLVAVFTQISAIGTWNFDEMLLFFGWSQFVKGIDHVYNDNIWTIGWWRLRDGSFNQFLTRPLGIIQQIVMERVQFDGFGELILGLGIFIYAWHRTGVELSLATVAVMAIFLVVGLVIYFAIKLATTAVAFWTVTSGELMTVAYEVGNFTRYPLDMYKSLFLRNMLIFILPFGVVSFLPIAWLLRGADFVITTLGLPGGGIALIVGGSVAIAAVLLGLALLAWNRGLRRYNPTGT